MLFNSNSITFETIPKPFDFRTFLGPSEKIRTSGLLNPINPFCHNSLLIIIKNVIYLTVCELFSDNLSNDSILFVVKIVVRLSGTGEVCLPPRLCIIIEK